MTMAKFREEDRQSMHVQATRSHCRRSPCLTLTSLTGVITTLDLVMI